MITFSHSETFTVTHEGRAIADYLAHEWAKQGKQVDTYEDAKTVTISYMTVESFYPEKELVNIFNKEGN